MKRLLKFITIFLTFGLMLVFTLLPSWALTPADQTPPAVYSVIESPHLIRPLVTITFTPVATIYLPLVIRSEIGPDPEPTTEPGGPNVKITRIEYDPATGTDAEGEFVEIQNLTTASVDMTGWILRDAVSTTFTFPAFSLNTQAKVQVWVKAGVDDSANLYWGRGSAVWNNGGDTATLRDAGGTDVDSCTYTGGDPGFTECN